MYSTGPAKIALIDFDGHGLTTTHHKDRSALVHALLHHREYFRLIAERFQAAKAGWDDEAATDARQDQINEMHRAALEGRDNG